MKVRKISRSKLRQAAKLAIAIHAYDLMQGITPQDVNLSEEEFQTMEEEAHKVAEKLAGIHPMNLGSVAQCIEYFNTSKGN